MGGRGARDVVGCDALNMISVMCAKEAQSGFDLAISGGGGGTKKIN